MSYSHADEQYRNELEKHLAPLRREGLVELWNDRRIPAGDLIDQSIRSELETADVVLLLISADFLNSDYCHDREMIRALERHDAGECRVIPIILRPCDWQNSPFSGLLAAPTDGKPISKHRDFDDAYLDVVSKIRAALGGTTARATSSPHPQSRPPANRPSTAPRSGNLGVTRSFSDYERDTFRTESFEYIRSYFESSIAELVNRNPDLKCLVRRVDANTVVVTAYSGGTRRSGCRISLGNSFREIAYSSDENSSPGSMSEWLTVEHDGLMIFLKAGGMRTGGNADAKLTMEGASEYLWSIFMEPLQRR